MFSYNVDPGNLSQVLDQAKGLAQFQPALEQCGLVALRSADLNFASGGRPASWTGLAPITLALRRGAGGGAQALRDTGRLQQSVVTRGSAGNVWRLEPHQLTFGSNLLYARIHQRGGTITTSKRTLARELTMAEYAQLKAQGFKNISIDKKTGRAWVRFGKSVRIPARPYLVIQPEDVRKFGLIFRDFVAQQMGEATS